MHFISFKYKKYNIEIFITDNKIDPIKFFLNIMYLF